MLINYNGESKVIKRICELLNTMSNVNFEVVAELPTVDISTSTIYLVPKSTAGQDNIYDEYINTDGTSAGWELIGDTEVDLSNYYTKTESDGRYVQPSSLSTVATTGDYDDLSNKPTIPNAVAVKGDAELTYRTGNVNLTPANIGALALTGGTLEGDLVLNKSWSQIVTDPPTPTDEYARLKFSTKYTPTGSSEISNASYIDAHSPGSNTGGNNLVINPRGNIFIGGGEAPNNHYNEKGMTTGEVTYITGDNVVNIQANANTIANRRGLQVSNSHTVVPILADTPTTNVGSIGSSNYKWKDMYATTFHGTLDGDASTVNGHTVAENVPSGAVFTDTTYTASGLVSIDANNNITTSAEANVQSDWSQSDNTADDYIKNKPTIPTVNDGTLTIKHNGTTKQTFTANQSTNVDADIEAVDWVSNGILGAKNRLFLPYYTQTSRINDVDVTMNTDGSIKLNGTASNITRVYLRGGAGTSRLEANVFKGMRAFMKYSTGVFNSDCYLYCQPYSSDLSEHDNINDLDGTGFLIPSNNRDLIRIAIYIKKNTVLNNLTVYPMVCLASDKDNTWQTYCLTNKELTDKKIGKWQDLGNWNTTTIGSSMSYSDKYDEFLIRIVGTTYSLDVHILNIAGVITGASGRIYRNYYQSDSQNYMAVNVGLTFGVDTIIFALETGTEEVINGSSQSIQQIRTFAR